MGTLVRDRIPGLSGELGGVYFPLQEPGYRAALRDKLLEETWEYLESGEVLEPADVLEAAYALTILDGMRATKAHERGSSAGRL